MRQLFVQRPYQMIWLAIPIILLLTAFGTGSALDIQLHDTYFVIAPFHVGLSIGIFCAITGGLYWLVRNKALITWMTVTHLMLTFIGILIIVISTIVPQHYSPHPVNERIDWENYQLMNQTIFMIILAWIFAQILFLVNLLIGLTTKRDR